ncbi:hypothetical protein BH10PLA2_BH10PLA2_23090 [soil metagenome]
MLGLVGGGTAALALFSLLGQERFGIRTGALTGVRLTAVTGDVVVRTASGRKIRPSGDIPAGGSLATFGPVSSAVVTCFDGSEFSFTGDSEVAVLASGTKMLLLQGTATANIPRHRPDSGVVTLQTVHASLNRMSDVLMTMARTSHGTEVGVQKGMVAVDSPAGQSLDIVHAGELLTVHSGGDRNKQLAPLTPDRFAWDLGRPLPSGWNVGVREKSPDGAYILPDMWLDPYYQVEMCQIRSDKQWACGFVRIFPE